LERIAEDRQQVERLPPGDVPRQAEHRPVLPREPRRVHGPRAEKWRLRGSISRLIQRHEETLPGRLRHRPRHLRLNPHLRPLPGRSPPTFTLSASTPAMKPPTRFRSSVRPRNSPRRGSDFSRPYLAGPHHSRNRSSAIDSRQTVSGLRTEPTIWSARSPPAG